MLHKNNKEPPAVTTLKRMFHSYNKKVSSVAIFVRMFHKNNKGTFFVVNVSGGFNIFISYLFIPIYILFKLSLILLLIHCTDWLVWPKILKMLKMMLQT